MTIARTLEFIGQTNIAEAIDDDYLLKKLAERVCDVAERDLDSMADWSNQVDEGERIAKQETKGKSEPWEGAANFKSPAILEAAISFGDRAMTELLRGDNLVKYGIIGKDPDGSKKMAGERTTEFMNYQINYEIKDWRKVQERLFYEIASLGTVFKKTFFDPIERRNVSELIHYPDYIVNQATQSMESCPAFTQQMEVAYNKVVSNQSAGIWRDVDIYGENENNEQSGSEKIFGDKGTNAEQESPNAMENPEKFYEQRCWFDLDEDGYEEPYIVTVHERTRTVMRIVAQYHADDIYVTNGRKTDKLENFTQEDPGNVRVVKITRQNDITKYDFINSTDGTFLGWGYYHILSSLTKMLNSTSNQLLDAGVLSNLQGGFVARGFRKRMGNLKVKPGAWEEINIAAADMHNGIMPHPFKEPSQTLYALSERMENAIEKISVNINLQGLIAPNAPATTTLALIQEVMVPTSAILKRIIMAESCEFMILFKLNSRFVDPPTYKEVLDDEDADFRLDFNMRGLDIMPTANPEMSSRMQRIQQSEIMKLEAPNIAMAGGDVRAIYERWFESIGAEDMIDKVWPSAEDMDAEQKARMEQMQAQQQKEQMLLNIEIDHKERQLELTEQMGRADMAVKFAELQEKLIELRHKEAEIISNIEKTRSDTVLNLEKAESEEVQNQVSVYTSELEPLRLAIEVVTKEIEAENARRTERADTRPTTPAPAERARLQPVA